MAAAPGTRIDDSAFSLEGLRARVASIERPPPRGESPREKAGLRRPFACALADKTPRRDFAYGAVQPLAMRQSLRSG
jgi:hypothetical protein